MTPTAQHPETPCEGERQSSGHTVRNALLDAAFVLLLATIWCVFVAYATGGQRALFYDTFRDTAYAENILAGRILTDPCINVG